MSAKTPLPPLRARYSPVPRLITRHFVPYQSPKYHTCARSLSFFSVSVSAPSAIVRYRPFSAFFSRQSLFAGSTLSAIHFS